MTLELLAGDFAVCQTSAWPPPEYAADFLFLARTDAEISVVCPEDRLPPACTAAETGWRAFRVAGQLDFALVGILAKIAAALAAEGISLFALSTFRTDYVLVKAEKLERAMAALGRAGCRFREA